MLALAVILAAAKLGGHLAVQLGQPAVLGELVAGVALGSLDLAGIGWFAGIESDQTVEILARWFHERLAGAIRGAGGEALAVRVWESPTAFGGYRAPLSASSE